MVKVKNRKTLHELLIKVFPNIKVYYYKPEEVVKPPYIVYTRKTPTRLHANNDQYIQRQPYELQFVRKNVDLDIYPILKKNFQHVRETNEMQVEGMLHTNYTIYW